MAESIQTECSSKTFTGSHFIALYCMIAFCQSVLLKTMMISTQLKFI